MYLAPELLRELATAAGVCVRPVLARCTDTVTGLDTTVPIPCGATLTRACPSCADRARRLRIQQCREGWHREDEPVPAEQPEEPDRLEDSDLDDPQDDEHDEDQIGDEDESIRRVRSTRRRQDAADLPRVPMADRTTGRAFQRPGGRVYRPSMFLTFTLDSYGRVLPDWTPVDPDSYDYRRAALDALHFPKLVDRLWQNLRRCAGYKVQYFAAVEPQRRLAPHLHAAVRGVIPRQVVRQVVAATYRQVWWPRCDTAVYNDGDALPVWDEHLGGYVDPHTGRSARAGGDTKTRKSRRTLALPLRCVGALTEHRRRQVAVRSAAGGRWQDLDLVFASATGTQLDAANVRRAFRQVIKASGLEPGEWTPRELRHSFVSLLSDAGLPLENISRLVGHSGSTVTELVYRKQIRPVITEGAETMDRIFPRPQDPEAGAGA